MIFIPTINFESDGSCYVAGLPYTVRDGNIALERKVRAWVADGIVRISDRAPEDCAGAGIFGHGTIR